MKLVKQKTSSTCGQACVAMLKQISLDAAVELVGHKTCTSDEEILTALGLSGPFTEGKPSNKIVALQKHRDPNGDKEHWTVSCYGKLFDPAQIGANLWPVFKFIKVR